MSIFFIGLCLSTRPFFSTTLFFVRPLLFYFYHRYSILQRLVVTLEKLLGDAKVAKVNSNVVTRMRKRFWNQVVQAVNENNSQLAADVYADTLNLPQTSTENILRKDSGYVLNRQFFCNPDLVICYKDLKTHLLKISSSANPPNISSFFLLDIFTFASSCVRSPQPLPQVNLDAVWCPRDF